MALSPSVRAMIESDALAHLVTLGPDSAPQVTCIWIGLDGDEIVSGHLYEHRKVRNIRRDPRVSLSFHAKEHTGEGLHPYVVIRGTARITEGGALAVMDMLAEHYLGPGERYPMREVPPGVVTHVTVEEISGMGPWRD